MKKGLIFSLIISIIGFLGLSIFAFLPKTNFSIDKIEEFNKFESSLISELQKDDYSYTEINKNVSLSQLKEKVEPNSKNNQATIFSMEDNKILTTNELNEYCEQNDLILEETDNGYQVINKYALKRLIVFGTLPNNHNASKVISYDNMNILCYNSIEETKQDYLLLKQNNIEATPDFILSAQSVNVSNRTSIVNNWSEVAINISSYTNYRTDKEVVVAVLDTGINTQHIWLKDRILKDTSGNMIGWAYHKSTNDHTDIEFDDDNGHGSHVAGIIVDQTPSNVKILPMKVLNKNGNGDFSEILTALNKIYLEYSNTYNIVCANLSLSGYRTGNELTTLTNSFNSAFNNLKSKNILSIVAAGNKSTSTNNYVPAACKDSAIVVSALKESTISPYMTFDSGYSNFGTSIDIGAPGTSITSAWKPFYDDNSNFIIQSQASADGTSQAAPHVAAAVANLALHKNKNLNATEIENKILSSAIDLGSTGFDEKYGHGALDYSLFNTISAIEHSSNNAIFTYDGNCHNISINVTQPTSGYTIKYSLENDGIYDITNINGLQAFKNANATAITIYYQITAPSYITVTGSKTLKINPKDVEISISNTTSVYGDSFNTNNIKFSCSEIVNNDNLGVTLNISKINFAQAGTYDVTYDGHTNTNYNITNPTTKGSHTIQKRTATINIANLTSTYGENFTLNQVNYSVVGLVNGDTINNITLSSNAVTGINPVGNYTVTATYTENNNYSISVNNGTLTIHPKDARINIGEGSSIYGNLVDLSSVTYSVNGLIGNDTIENILLNTTANSESDVNTYDISATYAKNDNYTISINTGIWSITPRIITIEITNSQITNQKIEYGNELNLDENSYSIKNGNILAKDQASFKINLTSKTNPNNSNSYLVYATCENSNYSIVLENNQITIVPRKITITIPDQSFEYGNVIDLQYSVTSGSFAFNDETSVKLSTTSTSSSPLGDYVIDITFNNMDKYDLTISKGKVTITPRQLNLEIKNQNFTYGDQINLNQLDYTIKSGSFAFNDQASVSLSTSATQSSNADEYAINLQFNNMNKYALTINNGKAIINPRPITISTQQSKIYGEENNLDNTIYTIEDGSVIEDTDLELTFTSTAKKLSPVGDYDIELSSYNLNYAITLINSYLTINPKLIEIYIFDQSGTYGNAVKLDNSQYSIDTFELIEGSDLEIILSTDADQTKPVGNYTITATTTNPNYILDVEEGTFTINKRKISIRLYNQTVPHTFSLNYNKEDYDIMSGSIVGNDELNIKLSTNATAMSFAGDYKIMATYLNDNYDITFTDATLTLEFSYVDALMILVPTSILILVATLVLVIVIKRKNKSIPLYKKWTK